MYTYVDPQVVPWLASARPVSANRHSLGRSELKSQKSSAGRLVVQRLANVFWLNDIRRRRGRGDNVLEGCLSGEPRGGVGEESRGRAVMRDSFVRGYGRNEAITHDGRRPGPRGDLSTRILKVKQTTTYATLASGRAGGRRCRRRLSRADERGCPPDTTTAPLPNADTSMSN